MKTTPTMAAIYAVILLLAAPWAFEASAAPKAPQEEHIYFFIASKDGSDFQVQGPKVMTENEAKEEAATLQRGFGVKDPEVRVRHIMKPDGSVCTTYYQDPKNPKKWRSQDELVPSGINGREQALRQLGMTVKFGPVCWAKLPEPTAAK